MSFVPLPLVAGPGLDLGRVLARPFVGEVVAWAEGTAYGVVTAGVAELVAGEDHFRLRAGSWFVRPGPASVRGAAGLVILDLATRGLAQLGGPLEPTGRLRYLDGCTDTLLACPPRLGEPSLNHLHLPAHTDQHPHTHASDRLGVIVRGRGACRTPEGLHPLEAGLGWWIPAGSEHSFVTTDHSLDVVAWHPDSVFGPTDEAHPMILGTRLAPGR